MAEDLQALLEKINHEGVEKAQAQAAQIIADAKVKSEALVKAAQEDAAQAKADAERQATDYVARARETLSQAARDTILKIEASVTKLLTDVLAKDVDRVLASDKSVAALVSEAIRGLTGKIDVAVSAKLAPALKAQLASQKTVTVVTDESLGTGFSVRLDGGRVEHTFTGDVIAAELAKRLRPDLAKLVAAK